ncbi:MAG: holo-ACP synthase [Nitrospirales bacterium]|nr:holo-ACP synthase [Nitrospirales bacterium]
MCGIGTDIVEIERIRQAVERWGDRFLQRVFTEGEIAFCYGRKDPFPGLAARFAAKEAMVKASRVPLPYREVDVVRGSTGAPSVALRGTAAELLSIGGHLRIHLSMSHERSHAVATVVLEKEEK